MNKIIEDTIQCFIKIDFQSNPQDFFNEEDIRAVLFTRLKDALKMDRRYFPSELTNPPIPFNTDLVKCEYSYENQSQSFDIAILHQDENVWVGKDVWESYYPGKVRQAEMYWNQPVRFGVEIKACWHTWDLKSRIDGIKSDREKLRNYQKNPFWAKNGNITNLPFEGVALLFVTHHPNEIDTSFQQVNNISLSSPCNAYCITSKEIFNIS